MADSIHKIKLNVNTQSCFSILHKIINLIINKRNKNIYDSEHFQYLILLKAIYLFIQ